MITAGKRKAAPTKNAAARTPAAAGASAAPAPAEAKSTGARKKRKTDTEAAVAVPPPEAEEEEEAAAEAEPESSDAELLAELESGILTSTSESIATHYNSIVRIIGIASKLGALEGALSSAPVDSIALGVSGVQAAVRVFTEWFAAGHFVLSKTASKKKSADATLQAIQSLLVVQYKKLWALLLKLLQADVAAVQSNALHAAMDLVQAEGISAAVAAAVPESTVTETLSNGSFHGLLRTLMLASPVLLETRKEFQETFVGQHADLRSNVYVQLKSLAHLSQADFATAQKEVGGAAASPGAQHIVEFLLDSDWQATLQKQWIVLSPPGGDDEDDLMGLPKMVSANSTPEALKKLYGDAWIGVLRHKQLVETYKKILEKLHSVIIPALPSPLLLADFLTDSYNIGGVVSLLALNGLFILISKFNLDYPSFFKKLYACCQPYVFHAKYRARFFQLVSLFLTSSYLPSYLVCAFTKRFARLSLTAPPSGAIFCIAVIYNLLRRHPVCRPLINRTLVTQPNAGQAQLVKKGQAKTVTEFIQPGAQPVTNGGILSSLASLLSARQAAAASGTLADPLNEPEENTALRLTLPVYQAPPPSHSLTLGRDPYLYEATDPEESQAQESSLWEIKSLTEHFSPTVANLAKVFFTQHAPKKDLEMNKYIEQSYETLFEKETDRRVNQKVALQQHHKFNGLFGDATQSIGLTFQLPSGTQQAEVIARRPEPMEE